MQHNTCIFSLPARAASFGLTASDAAATAADFFTPVFHGCINRASEILRSRMSSFFPWMGGKSKVAARLAELLPVHSCYVEVFAGAANLFFAKVPSRVEVINDVNSDLVNLFRVVRCHHREFVRELEFMLHSRRDFDDFKSQPGLTDIQRAARYWTILKTAFGGKGGTPDCHFGYGASGRSRFKRCALSLVKKAHRRLDGVFVECLDFRRVIEKYDRPHTCFFYDPPYYQTAGYRDAFSLDDHKDLASMSASIAGKFLLTVNDHPAIRRLYKGFSILPVKVSYSISREKTASAQERKELLIANYPLPRRF